MAFLIILIVATAALILWLLFEVARLVFGDLRLQSVSSGPSPVTRVAETIAPSPPRENPVPDPAAQATAWPRASAPEPAEERVLYDEVDAEQAVRDRLYGGRGRRA